MKQGREKQSKYKQKTGWLLVLFSPPFVFLLLYLTLLSPDPCHYFHQKELSLHPYADKENKGGASEVQSAVLDNGQLNMQYILRDGYVVPYAGVSLNTDHFIDLTRYNRLKINASLNRGDDQEGEVFLLFHEPAVANQSHRLAARHLKTEVAFSKDGPTMVLPLDHFETPDWWLDTFGWSRQNTPASQWDQFKGLNVVVKGDNTYDEVRQLAVREAIFYRDNTADVIYYGLIHVLIVVGYGLSKIYYSRKSKKLDAVTVHYKAIQGNETTGSGDAFMKYIHQHYDDADLTLGQIEKATGTSTRTISASITDRFGINFKTYLNQIRVVEAQRLLTTTTLSISEVAYTTGFNSPASFNRVFKQKTGQTPSEYRKTAEH